MAAITVEVNPSDEMKQVLDQLEKFALRMDEIMNSKEVQTLIALYPELYKEVAQDIINDLVEKQKNYDKDDQATR